MILDIHTWRADALHAAQREQRALWAALGRHGSGHVSAPLAVAEMAARLDALEAVARLAVAYGAAYAAWREASARGEPWAVIDPLAVAADGARDALLAALVLVEV